jgi:hypothetical protein
MLIKLTYYGTNRATLVNLGNVESIYQVFDKQQKRFSTKICFKGNQSFINVEEDLQTIMKIQQDCLEGNYQSTEFTTPTIEERFEDSYYRQENQYTPRRRERNYNNQNSLNDTQW